MKKYSILLVFILLFTGSLFSQEIFGPDMRLEGIYIDSNINLDSLSKTMDTSLYIGTFVLGGIENTFSVCPDKGMWIYGIAAPVVARKENYSEAGLQFVWQIINQNPSYTNFYDEYIDTTYDQCFEYFRFYKKTASNGLYAEFEMMKEGMVHVLDSNVIGYFDCGNAPWNFKRYIPIRAVYFDEPIFVSDTFYIGMTNYNRLCGTPRRGRTWTFRYTGIGDESGNIFQRHFCRISPTENIWENEDYYGFVTYIFPLIASVPMYPSPLVTGGEMAGAPVLTVENFVSVAPNPATESATIASSFPLEAVELYDLGGSLLLRQPCSGLSLSLDLRPFPSGTYILKAKTRNGTATKKLIKQ